MKRKILIVEDDTPLYNLYKTELELKGYSVSNVSDGNLAYDAVKTQKPDLVLLDLMLPGKNGLQILEEVKTQPETKEVRVVMLTNFGNEDNVRKALELGAEDYVMKYNIVPAELSEKVVTLLGDQDDSAVKFLD
jgi:two-component system, OmpR family, phosphate regulon response regulator PhoB